MLSLKSQRLGQVLGTWHGDSGGRDMFRSWPQALHSPSQCPSCKPGEGSVPPSLQLSDLQEGTGSWEQADPRDTRTPGSCSSIYLTPIKNQVLCQVLPTTCLPAPWEGGFAPMHRSHVHRGPVAQCHGRRFPPSVPAVSSQGHWERPSPRCLPSNPVQGAHAGVPSTFLH